MENRKLRVDLYGNVKIRFGDEDITGRISKKSIGVIAFLLSSSGEAVSKNTLKNLFWIDAGDKASYNLRFNLWNIGRNIPQINENSLIISDRYTCRINPDYPLEKGILSRVYDGSVQEMEETLEEIRRLRFTDLTFMENFSLKDSDEFNDWLILERNNRERKLVEFLYSLVGYLEERARYHEALEILERIVFLSPFEDEACIRLMKLYSLMGKTGSALREYKRYASFLKRELNAEPSARVNMCRDMIKGDRNEENGGPLIVNINPCEDDFEGAGELLRTLLKELDRKVCVIGSNTDRKSAELFERFKETGLIEIQGGRNEDKS